MERSLGAEALLDESWNTPWLDDDVFPYWPEAASIGNLERFLQWLVVQDSHRAALVLTHPREFEKVHRLVTGELTRTRHQQQQNKHRQPLSSAPRATARVTTGNGGRPPAAGKTVRSLGTDAAAAAESSREAGPTVTRNGLVRNERARGRNNNGTTHSARSRSAEYSTAHVRSTNRVGRMSVGSGFKGGSGGSRSRSGSGSGGDSTSGRTHVPPSLKNGSHSWPPPATRYPKSYNKYKHRRYDSHASTSISVAAPFTGKPVGQEVVPRPSPANDRSSSAIPASSAATNSSPRRQRQPPLLGRAWSNFGVGSSAAIGGRAGGGVDTSAGRVATSGQGALHANSSWTATSDTAAVAAAMATDRVADVRQAAVLAAESLLRRSSLLVSDGEESGSGNNDESGTWDNGGRQTSKDQRAASVRRPDEPAIQEVRPVPPRLRLPQETLAKADLTLAARDTRSRNRLLLFTSPCPSSPSPLSVNAIVPDSISSNNIVELNIPSPTERRILTPRRYTFLDNVDEEEEMLAGESSESESWICMRDPVSLRKFWFDPKTRAAKWEGGGAMEDDSGGLGLGLLSWEERERLKCKFERRQRRGRHRGAPAVAGGVMRRSRSGAGLREHVLRKLTLDGESDGKGTEAPGAGGGEGVQRGAAAVSFFPGVVRTA